MGCVSVALAKSYPQAVFICLPDSAPHWSAFLPPLLILASIIVAVFGIRNARSVARQKATLDLIEKKESTEHYQTIHKVFLDVRKGGRFGPLSDPVDEDARESRKQVLDYLNHYEMVAIGIRRNILDEQMYRDWMEGAFVRDWNAAADFIQAERWRRTADGKDWEYRAAIYANFQWAACRWSPEARQLHLGEKPETQTPSGVGDEHLPVSSDS